ncbi:MULTISPECIES: class I SAM-dependent DNA methyltransferase [unclassified Mesorhizobium]|uniref:HsdM family class I SAM-dependent methyltransferase n=1 Tax=unclassified Mesorhizobium TaxID=325217 RepID=UPI001CCAB82C|nr:MULTISPECIES: N-6 DNA methylase [unclassified Mesorhizobium]MBZ9679640.1 SAM-dependent methyltransferase [Mesorhizobium sp. CO1-1-2]MBZ9925008.1 SAM-dependent methyltransferase [Mesorhizobium sp. BR1-1-4]
MNEWGFASEISKWWEQAAAANPSWRLNSVRVEEHVPGSRQRSDLIVFGDNAALCGEIRLPDHPRSSPLDFDNLKDAVYKAQARGCRWAFTSDARTLLLIDTQQTGSLITRIVHREEVGSPFSRADLDDPNFLKRVSSTWREAFNSLAPIITGAVKPAGMAADALFVDALRELMAAPVSAIRDAMNERRQSDPEFSGRLIEWMVDDQGWTHNPARWNDEVTRAAKLTAYVFVTRIMFYEALRRTKPQLDPLVMPPAPLSSAKLAANTLTFLFGEARRISGDYETLFTWDQVSEYAMMSDSCVPHWRRLIEHIEHFDVSAIDHDILGRLFERLIEPHERYEWGQHYTSSDVVDLMLSFAMPDGKGPILDPATGGGTFLVRAYARKKYLVPEQTHQDRLRELFGVDVSHFAATMATVNLAIRKLEFEDNYPRVKARSFFLVQPDEEFMRLPAGSDEPTQQSPVMLPLMRAVVGNPPYVRMHKLGDDRQREVEKILGRGVRIRAPKRISGLANYHLFFWFHAAQFLQPNGTIAFLTSGEWLDSDYGAALQLWLLDNFKIHAFIESGAEAWFSEARVGTVVTVASHCPDQKERDANVVRFVTLRRTIRDLVGISENEAAHLSAVDRLRDRILQLTGANETDDLDWSALPQSELIQLGAH